MKLPLLFALAALALGTGCNSLENPLANLGLLHSGHDARTYNAQTGAFEWPRDATPRPARRLARTAPAAPPAPPDDGRSFDPQRGAFRDPQPGR